MATLGVLIPYAIYIFLALFCLGFLVLAFYAPKRKKIWHLLGSACCIFLIVEFKSSSKEAYGKNQLDQVGIYWLTAYPNCKSCYLELKEDNTYVIINQGKIIESSNWHFESGSDYLITFLDNDKGQLGSGKYAYEGRILLDTRSAY